LQTVSIGTIIVAVFWLNARYSLHDSLIICIHLVLTSVVHVTMGIGDVYKLT